MDVRGESNDLLKILDQTAETVKAMRCADSEKAAAILSVKDIEYWGFEDYPIPFDHERVQRMIKKIRQTRPDYVITHGKNDLFNPNHNEAAKPFFSCCVQLNSVGVRMEGLLNIKKMTIYGFEPHQVEILGYVPASWWTLPGPMIRR